jgi:DNA-binding beta-propeller fold protein YncE
MDQHQFDAALRALQAGTTRRAGLAGALGVLLGGRAGALAGDAARGQTDASRAQASPESGGWHYQSQFGTRCGSTTGHCLANPFGMSISADGTTAYVIDTLPLVAARVAVYSRNPGSTTWYYSHAFGNGSLSDALSIAVSGDELTAWVADTRKHRILIWTRPSISSTTWSNSAQFGSYGSGDSNFSYPRGVVVSADSLTTWVADMINDRISIWTRPSTSSKTWSYRDSFGTRGEGDSNFRSPRGIAVSADTLTIWIADHKNQRISVWARPDKDSTDWRPSAQFSGFGTGPSALKYPQRVAVTPDGRTALVSGVNSIGFSAGVVEIWTKS